MLTAECQLQALTISKQRHTSILMLTSTKSSRACDWGQFSTFSSNSYTCPPCKLDVVLHTAACRPGFACPRESTSSVLACPAIVAISGGTSWSLAVQYFVGSPLSSRCVAINDVVVKWSLLGSCTGRIVACSLRARGASSRYCVVTVRSLLCSCGPRRVTVVVRTLCKGEPTTIDWSFLGLRADDRYGQSLSRKGR